MKCKDSNFWIGLGIGSVAGALAYHFSRRRKLKSWKMPYAVPSTKQVAKPRSSPTLLKKKHCTLAPK